jgi:phage gpG-like protein
MIDGTRIDFFELERVVGVYAERGQRVPVDLAHAVAEGLVTQVQEVFDTEGFGKWPRFWWEREGLPKPAGRRWKGNARLLQDTGRLAASITPATEDDTAIAFTEVDYAVYHVSRAPRTKIPLRDFFDIDIAAFKEDVGDMIDLWMSRPIAAE